jgi:hypothetical protein
MARSESNYELSTPYGTLVVSRMVGWKVERNGVPLVTSFHPRQIIIFDKLEDAQICGLRAVRGGARCRADETSWGVDDQPERSAA